MTGLLPTMAHLRSVILMCVCPSCFSGLDKLPFCRAASDAATATPESDPITSLRVQLAIASLVRTYLKSNGDDPSTHPRPLKELRYAKLLLFPSRLIGRHETSALRRNSP